MLIDLNMADQLPADLQMQVREAVQQLERLRAAYSLATSRNLDSMFLSICLYIYVI